MTEENSRAIGYLMKSFVVQCSANNELRIGWQDLPCRKKNYGDKSQDKKNQVKAEHVALAETEVIRVGDRGYLIDRVHGCSILTRDEADRHEERQKRSLDIISDFQQEVYGPIDTRKTGWGILPKVTVFGAYARHTILEGGAVASRGNGEVGRGVEVTLTIPGHSRSAFRAVAEWSGYACNRILQVVRRHKSPIDWFYVWELQKRGALHLHMALSGVPDSELLRVGREIRKCWFRVLEEIGRRASTNMFIRRGGRGSNTYRQFLKGNRVAPIKKSLAAYFAKYVSKGASRETKEKVVHWYPPARWWGMSRSLLRKVKNERLVVRFSGVSEQELVGLLSSALGWVRRYNPVRDCGYGFDVSYGEGAHRKQMGYGERFISWFSDSDFGALKVWLPQLLRHLLAQCSNAVIEGQIDWALHTPAWG